MASRNFIGGAILGAALAMSSPLDNEVNNHTFQTEIYSTSVRVDSLVKQVGLEKTNLPPTDGFENKKYLAVIDPRDLSSIRTYTVNPGRIIANTQCKITGILGETLVVSIPLDEGSISEIVNDNPEDPVEETELTYNIGNGSTFQACNDLSSYECTLSPEEYMNFAYELTNGKDCGSDNVSEKISVGTPI